MIIQDELNKAAIQYHIKRMVTEIVSFTVVFALIYYNMFNYEPGWFWIIENCVLIVLLCLCGRDYKKKKIEVAKALDKVLKIV